MRTPEQIAGQLSGNYANYIKQKRMEDVGHFLQNYVVDGGGVTQDPTFNNRIVAEEIVVSLNGDVMRRDGQWFTTRFPLSTWYLDFGKDGDWHWSTSHPAGTAGTDYLTIATVTTNSIGNVATITDTRGHVGGFLLKDEYGLENYATQAQLADTLIVNVKTRGALSGGNDDTAIIQAIINTAPAGTTIIGDGREYIVSGLDIRRSNLSIRDLKLKLKDGDNYWKSPIRIIGTWENATSNIEIDNVQINGNRTNQTNISKDGSGNTTESRSGIGIYGVVSDITINKVVSQYNAGDGIWISCGLDIVTDGESQRRNDNELCINNVRVSNSIFTYNRRHGGALDSCHDVIFGNCIFDENGKDIDGGLTDGSRGETFNGNLYAYGFDAEAMAEGLTYRNIHWRNCSFQNNAGLALAIIQMSVSVTYPSFRQIEDIYVENCILKGHSSDSDINSLYITPRNSNVNVRKIYNSIHINGCTLLDGGATVASAENVFVDTTTFKDLTPTNVLNFLASTGVIVSNSPATNYKTYFDGTGTFIQNTNFMYNRKVHKVSAYADLAGISTPQRGDIAINNLPTGHGVRAWIYTTIGWQVFAMDPTYHSGAMPGTSTITAYLDYYAADGSLAGYIPIYTN